MNKPRLFTYLCCVLLALTTVVHAQIAVGITDDDRAEFARHRAAFLERLGDDVAVMFGAPYREDFLRFRQDNTFYYFTGVEIPTAAIVFNGGDDTVILLIPNAIDNVWVGKTLGPGPEAVTEFGINDIRLISNINAVLQQAAPSGGRIGTMLKREEPVCGGRDAAWIEKYRDSGWGFPWEMHETSIERQRAWLEEILPGRTVFDVSPIVDDLRRIKSSWEIKLMKKACEIAGEGHVAAIKATKQGVYEWVIEAAAIASFVNEGALYPSYGAIVGSGKNSAILHYPHSSKLVTKKDLVLMDFGPDYRYYSADITRTWPAKGKFKKKHLKVYNACLEIQKKLIKFIKPGITLRDLNNKNKELMQQMGYANNYFHGPSHFIGMSVHDVGDYHKPLEAGCVITVEPGIYFKNKWGVRIEDVVLVTQDGCRVLSDMIPKEPDEIEALMAGS